MPTGPPDFFSIQPGEQESTADRIIRQAMEAGEFDDLPGLGKPIPGAGNIDDDLWWVRSWMERNRDSDGQAPSNRV
jgi:hypothetical protein